MTSEEIARARVLSDAWLAGVLSEEDMPEAMRLFGQMLEIVASDAMVTLHGARVGSIVRTKKKTWLTLAWGARTSPSKKKLNKLILCLGAEREKPSLDAGDRDDQ